jgi:hypothetical protein
MKIDLALCMSNKIYYKVGSSHSHHYKFHLYTHKYRFLNYFLQDQSINIRQMDSEKSHNLDMLNNLLVQFLYNFDKRDYIWYTILHLNYNNFQPHIYIIHILIFVGLCKLSTDLRWDLHMKRIQLSRVDKPLNYCIHSYRHIFHYRE